MSLLDPIALGPRTAPNRVMFGPHETNLGRGRSISDRHVAYYARRAEGGAGVIVVEEASVHESDWPYERAPLATESEPGWAAVADACHPYGALVIASLGHAGGQGTSHWSQRELWAPSRVPEVDTREVPKQMEAADVAAVVDGCGTAAAMAVAAGLDGVEINAGQHSLVRQFLSGLTNQRDDEWADRTRFARELLEATRAGLGSDAVLGLRLSCDEYAPWAGITPDDAGALAAELARFVDYLVVVSGSIFTVAATRPDTHEPAGFNLGLSASVRSAVREAHGDCVRVVAQGSIVAVAMAEGALKDGAADLVEMTRAQIADPDLVAKVRAGSVEAVRPCVRCNQQCRVRDNRNPIVSCIGEPRSGHETTDPEPPGTPVTAGALGRVTVVGAGPAGLEAARVASLRGAEVMLIDAADRVGGSVRAWSGAPGRESLVELVDWLEAECRRLGVAVELGRAVTPGDLGRLGADDGHLLLATGSAAGERGYAVTPAAQVVNAAELLARLQPAPVQASGAWQEGEASNIADRLGLPPGPVAVWDPIGGPIAVSVAELLAGHGRPVHLITPDQIVGNELSRTGDLAPANARLAQAGVSLHRRRILRKVRKRDVEVENRFTGELERIAANSLIDAGHRLPDDTFADVDRSVSRAGDCVAPRTIAQAVLEGRRWALSL
ncbi:MAG: mycofactocin system FadH/OYE family oxidoreductase 1 [Microthrixaceae bacterium]